MGTRVASEISGSPASAPVLAPASRARCPAPSAVSHAAAGIGGRVKRSGFHAADGGVGGACAAGAKRVLQSVTTCPSTVPARPTRHCSMDRCKPISPLARSSHG